MPAQCCEGSAGETTGREGLTGRVAAGLHWTERSMEGPEQPGGRRAGPGGRALRSLLRPRSMSLVLTGLFLRGGDMTLILI